MGHLRIIMIFNYSNGIGQNLQSNQTVQFVNAAMDLIKAIT